MMNNRTWLDSLLSCGFRGTITRSGRIGLLTAVVLAGVGGAARLHAAAAKADAGMRAWTSAAGSVIQAQFVEMKAGNVVLRGEKGELFSISPAALSAADREFVQKVLAEAATAMNASVIPAGSNTLATFKGGAWNGAAVVYTNQFFAFTMNKTGGWKLQILDKGTPVGEPLTDGGPGGSYHDKDYKKPGWKAGDSIGRRVGRPLVSFDKRPEQPLMQPASIELAGMLSDGVAFECLITFNFNKIEYSSSIRDPAGITYPTECGISVVFPVSHKFENGTTWDAIVAALAGHRLTIQPQKGNPKVVEYQETLAKDEIRSLEAIGPWGARKIRVDTPEERGTDRWGRLRNYGNNEPYRGFSISRGVVGNGSTGRIMITVE